MAGGFVSAAALTLVAQHLFEGRAGFEPTFRVVAYAAAPIVLFWVPRLWVLALLYGWYLQIRGVERVNEFEPHSRGPDGRHQDRRPDTARRRSPRLAAVIPRGRARDRG